MFKNVWVEKDFLFYFFLNAKKKFGKQICLQKRNGKKTFCE